MENARHILEKCGGSRKLAAPQVIKTLASKKEKYEPENK